MKKILILICLCLSISGWVYAGTFEGLKPGTSSKSDADRILGEPIKEVIKGLRYDYNTEEYEASRISIKFKKDTLIIETIDLYPEEASYKSQFTEGFGLGKPTRIVIDKEKNLSEYYLPKAISLHYEGEDDSFPIRFFSHFDPSLFKPTPAPPSEPTPEPPYILEPPLEPPSEPTPEPPYILPRPPYMPRPPFPYEPPEPPEELLCGGEVQCQCGGVLTSSQTMWYSLDSCPGSGLIIGADNVTLDCTGYSIGGGDFGSGIYASGKKGISIQNCKVQKFEFGIFLESSSGNYVTNNRVENSGHGIRLYHSNNNKLQGNVVSNSTYYGIGVSRSDNNVLTKNTANKGARHGISVSVGSHNVLTDNTANNNNMYGIYLDSDSNDNQLTGNTTNGNSVGIYLSSRSKENRITRSRIAENIKYGAYIKNAHNNTFRNNSFTKNGTNAYEEATATNNNWDFNGVGNYWDDYPGYPDYYEIPGPGDGIDRYPVR